MYRIIKVILDFLLAFFILMITAPILLFLLLLLYIHFKSSPIFMQKRIGYKNRVFHIYKLKTMKDLYDLQGNPLPDMMRITKLGSVIRKFSIDELPQIINILKLDMSFIGPRPLSVKNLPYYTKKELLRHCVRPGITGLAQISGRNNISWDKRLELDILYYENISFKLDCEIFIKTIKNVLAQKDITTTPQIASFVKTRINDSNTNNS